MDRLIEPPRANRDLARQVEKQDRQRRRREQRQVRPGQPVEPAVMSHHHGWEDQERQRDHQQVGAVVRQVHERLESGAEWDGRPQHPAEELASRLDRALCPAELLALEAVDVDR